MHVAINSYYLFESVLLLGRELVYRLIADNLSNGSNKKWVGDEEIQTSYAIDTTSRKPCDKDVMD